MDKIASPAFPEQIRVLFLAKMSGEKGKSVFWSSNYVGYLFISRDQVRSHAVFMGLKQIRAAVAVLI